MDFLGSKLDLMLAQYKKSVILMENFKKTAQVASHPLWDTSPSSSGNCVKDDIKETDEGLQMS